MAKARPKSKSPTRAATKKPATNATHKKRAASWQERFLELFSESLNITQAAQGVNINRATAYRERVRDPEFAAAWDDAKVAAIEQLEATAYERARKMSDVLLIFLLKAHKPEVYRENMNVHHSGAVNLTFTELAKLATDE